MSLGTILLIVLILMLLGVLPTWGYSSKMGLWAHRWCWTARVDTGDFASDGQDIARHMKSTFRSSLPSFYCVAAAGRKTTRDRLRLRFPLSNRTRFKTGRSAAVSPRRCG